MGAVVSLPQNPGGEDTYSYWFPGYETEFVLDSSFTYTGPINFRVGEFLVGGAEYDSNPKLTLFKGATGDEQLSFSDIVYKDSLPDEEKSSFHLFFDYETEISFENLGSLCITNNRIRSFLVSSCRGDARYFIRDIKDDVLFSGNRSESSLFYFYGMDVKGVQENGSWLRGGSLVFNISDIGGNVRFVDNTGGCMVQIRLVSPDAFEGLIFPGKEAKTVVEFKNIGGQLEFSRNDGVLGLDTSDCTNENNHVVVSFENIGQGVKFEGNGDGTHMEDCSGIYINLKSYNGADRVYQGQADISFRNIGGQGVEFLNNKGGAIYVDNAINASFSLVDSNGVNFTGNDYGASANRRRGGAAVGCEVKNKMDFLISGIVGDVVFDSNKATNNGGAVYLYASSATEGKITMSLNNIQGDVRFRNNVAGTPYAVSGGIPVAQGGAVMLWAPEMNFSLEDIGGSVEFSGNTATNNGGAIAFSAGQKATARFARIGEGLVFSANSAKGWGGALYFGSNDNNLFFGDVMGNIEFRDNVSTGAGGAIGMFGAKTTAVFSADGGDIVFSGNTDSNGARANSLSVRADEAHLDFRAREGKSIILNDPLYYSVKTVGTEGTFETHLNRTSKDGLKYTGRIVFSGELYDPANGAGNLASVIVGDTTLHAGTLVLESGAQYGTFGAMEEGGVDFDSFKARSFTMRNSLLDINGGGRADTVLAARSVTFDAGSTMKPGEQTWLVSQNTDMSQGLAFDLGYYLTPDTVLPLDGLQIVSSTLTLGNGLSIADKGAKLEYYENARWRQKQTFTLADVTQVETVTGDFSGIISQLAGSDIVKGFGYNGTWSYENKDGQLLAIWSPNATPNPDPDPTPNPEPEPDKSVHPELAGNLTLNSLWSTVSNMRAFSRSALGQVGLTRFLLPKNTNYWALGLGDFSSHRNAGSIDGYDYHGFGYAVGADTKLSDNLITGLAFGNLYGKNKSRNYNAHIDQASYISLAYGSWFKELDKSNSLVLNGTASYGLTANKMDIRYSDGDRSRGKWDNNALRLTLKGEWNHALNGQWTLTPFVGVEYDNAQQKSFTETGDKSRRFERASLRNLALPVGAGISHTTSYSNGMKWLNSVALSYVPDVYRKNPKSETLRTTNGFTWTAEGLRPVRNAGRVEYSTRLIVNETWSLFGGYMLEGRKDALYHNANLGVSASF